MRKVPHDPTIADEQEVLAAITSIMRRDTPEDRPKVAEVTKAAELLGKHYGLFDSGRKEAPPQRSAVAVQIDKAIREMTRHDQSPAGSA